MYVDGPSKALRGAAEEIVVTAWARRNEWLGEKKREFLTFWLFKSSPALGPEETVSSSLSTLSAELIGPLSGFKGS